jgi:hypothetical protein
MIGKGMWHAWFSRREVRTGPWCGNLREGHNLEDLGGGLDDNIKMAIKKNGKEWAGLIWRRIGTSGGLL